MGMGCLSFGFSANTVSSLCILPPQNITISKETARDAMFQSTTSSLRSCHGGFLVSIRTGNTQGDSNGIQEGDGCVGCFEWTTMHGCEFPFHLYFSFLSYFMLREREENGSVL